MGVLHRDIKPENVLFLQGHPIVADFGIAKAVSTAGGANITRTGFPVGAMTIGGVEALAGEVGVAPELVRAAADSLGAPAPVSGGAAPSRSPNQPNPWISGPTRLVFERTVDGELPDTEYETVVDEIRQVLQDAGQVSQFGRSFTWVAVRSGSNSGARRNLEITVSIRAGRTRIMVQENLANLIGGVFGGIGGGMGGGGMGPVMGILGGVLHLGPVTALFVPIWLGVTYATARYVYRRLVGKRARELEELADRLATLAQDLVVLPHRLKP